MNNKIITNKVVFENLSNAETRKKESECRGFGWNYIVHKADGMIIDCKITIPKTNIPCQQQKP